MIYVQIGLFCAIAMFALYITFSLYLVYRCVGKIKIVTHYFYDASNEAAKAQIQFAKVLRRNNARCTVATAHYHEKDSSVVWALKTVNDQISLYVSRNPQALKDETVYQYHLTYCRYYADFLKLESRREALYDRMQSYRMNFFLSAFAEAAQDKLPPRTDTKRRVFGMGLMRLPLLANGEVDLSQCMDMADCMIQNGFTYFDTAYFYLDGRSEGVAKSILCQRYPRASFQLADKMPLSMLQTKEDVARIFGEQLERTGAEYFDYYLLHAMNAKNYDAKAKEFEVFEFIKEQKEKGTVRKMGFSFHDKPEVLDRILADHPEVDFVQLQINYYDWETNAVASRRCYEVARHHGKPIVVMEPVKGGNLASMPDQIKEMIPDLLEKDSPATLALRFAATKEEIMMVLSGMSTIGQTVENVKRMRDLTPLSAEDFQRLVKVGSAMRKIPTHSCTACRYCLEVCPRHLPIPDLIKAVNRRLLGSTERIDQAKLCIGCGACESRCPQKLKIRKILQQAAEK